MENNHSYTTQPLTANQIRTYDARMEEVRANHVADVDTIRCCVVPNLQKILSLYQLHQGKQLATESKTSKSIPNDFTFRKEYIKPSRLTRGVPKENKWGVGLGYEHHRSEANRLYGGKLSIPEKGGSIHLHTDKNKKVRDVRTVGDIETVRYQAFIAHCQSAINTGVFHFNSNGVYDLTVVPAFRNQGAYEPQLARKAFKAALGGDITKPGALEIAAGFGLFDPTDIIGSQVPSYLDIGLQTTSAEARSNWELNTIRSVSLDSMCEDIGFDGSNVIIVPEKDSHSDPFKSSEYYESRASRADRTP